jgi:hypothetical protein
MKAQVAGSGTATVGVVGVVPVGGVVSVGGGVVSVGGVDTAGFDPRKPDGDPPVPVKNEGVGPLWEDSNGPPPIPGIWPES